MPARAVAEHAGPQATAGHPAHKKRHARRPPKASDIPAPALPLPAAQSRRIGADLDRRPAGPREFRLLVLLHDDLYYIPECMRPATSLAVTPSCLTRRQWVETQLLDGWLANFRTFFGAHFDSVRLEIAENQPGLTDFDYRAHPTAAQASDAWAAKINDRFPLSQDPQTARWQTKNEKFVVLVKHAMPLIAGELRFHPMAATSRFTTANGIASVCNRSAIAIANKGTIHHEIGHLCGADHEDAEIMWGRGWFCETFMRVPDLLSGLRKSCGWYSVKNIRHMQDYFAAAAPDCKRKEVY